MAVDHSTPGPPSRGLEGRILPQPPLSVFSLTPLAPAAAYSGFLHEQGGNALLVPCGVMGCVATDIFGHLLTWGAYVIQPRAGAIPVRRVRLAAMK